MISFSTDYFDQFLHCISFPIPIVYLFPFQFPIHSDALVFQFNFLNNFTFFNFLLILSVQFSCSVMSDSLIPHELWHTRSNCPSPTPGVYTNPCPLSESVTQSNDLILCLPLLLLPSIFPNIRVSSNESALHSSGGQSIAISASTSVLPMNTQD